MAFSLAWPRRFRVVWHNWRLRLAVVPRWRTRRELRALLHAREETLDAKLRHRHLRGLCQRAIALEPNIFSLTSETPQLRRCSYATLLMRLVDTLSSENRRLEQQFLSLERQAHLALDDKSYYALLEQHLRSQAPTILAYLQDLRALSRRLDLDALRERCDEARARNYLLMEMAIGGASTLWQRALALAPGPTQEVRARVHDAQPLFELSRLFFEHPRWSTRYKITQELVALARLNASSMLDPKALRRFHLVYEDPEAHPWIRRNAIRIIAEQTPQSALDSIKALLERRPPAHPYAFLTRTLLLQELARLCDTHPRALDILLEHWKRSDPSEHVRIRLLEALAGLGGQQERILTAVTQRVCLHHSDRPSEVSPKVRARGLMLFGQFMQTAMQDPSAPQARGILALCAQAISSYLFDEQDPWVLAQCCTQIQTIVKTIPSVGLSPELAPFFEQWSQGLRLVRDQADAKASLTDRACATLDLIAIMRAPQTRQLYVKLSRLTPEIRPGTRVRFTLPPTQGRVQPRALGRVLAQLSADDWGLYATMKGNKIRLQRGDRWHLRLWRVLHELRTPGPNKRKGFVHSSARYVSGALRAPPGRLDEATPTLVPGERVSLAGHEGWAGHLPLVDDLLSRPPFKPEPPIEIFSSYGVTSIQHPASWIQRCWNGLRISWRYAQLSTLRLNALQDLDPRGRRAYLDALARDYGIRVQISPHPDDAPRIPVSVHQLFGEAPTTVPDLQEQRMQRAAAWLPALSLDLDPLVWLQEHTHYFLSEQGNDQQSLSLFLTGILGLFLFSGYRRRRALRIARSRIPLSVGGWGTRGKSGTERLKAAMFHGLGYRVFSKTTGCEAMFIHSVAEGPQSEIFAFRPYGKATIWEQGDLLKLAARLDVDVFLWECMALNPTYVSILQHAWMNDDIATITNAYPDHEDIQGPAGINVAQVISQFVPKGAVAISSEINFHPVIRDHAKAQGSAYIRIPPDQEAWIGEDFLAQFPYQEHPRNIALVAKLGESLGIEADLAIYNMARHVVPDLGVLKTYGDIQVRGRTLRFINGCSANERAGFLNNWSCTGCDQISVDDDPHKMVVTVVNNRGDRISRSEVFARILVNDAPADKHILIGSNLGGLLGYIDHAIDELLEGYRPHKGARLTQPRFEALMQCFRCPDARAELWTQRLKIYARGAGLELPAHSLATLQARLESEIARLTESSHSLQALREQLQANVSLTQSVQQCLDEGHPAQSLRITECLTSPLHTEIVEHWCLQLSRALCIAGLRRACLNTSQGRHYEQVCERFRELFHDTLHRVGDQDISGDQLVVRCATLVPPGVDLTLMGTQNIKGTGLDFVYRWVAFGQVQTALGAFDANNLQTRAKALDALQAFGDHGLLDLGLLRGRLEQIRARSDDEAAKLDRLRHKVARLYAARVQGLQSSSGSSRQGPWALALHWLEGWVEFLDGARRYHQSRSLMRDLVKGRVSHANATLEMREVYARQKGGWLAKWWSG